MDALKEWIQLAAGICLAGGVLLGLITDESRRKLLRLLLGVILLLTLAQIGKDADWSHLTDWSLGALPSGADVSQQGREMSLEAMSGLIKAKYEAYVLEKAKGIRQGFQVDITLHEDLTPMSARIRGEFTPEAQEALAVILEQELGIPKEDQHWSG